MEREVWLEIVTQVRALANPVAARFTFAESQIVLVQAWAALHDRPVYWACQIANWPAELRPARLPTPSTMTRRLRSAAVRALLKRVERRARGPARHSLLHIVDGKALPIARHSRDRDARFGRGAGGLNKGYKMHVITSQNADLKAWCVRPMNRHEAHTARELLADARLSGYLLADANYDQNALYHDCRQRGIQLLTPRRYGAGRGVGHHRHDPARLYAINQLEQSLTGFAPQLMHERGRIERWFGGLCSSSFGLTHLPPWARTLARVERWITAKLIVWHCAKRVKKRLN